MPVRINRWLSAGLLVVAPRCVHICPDDAFARSAHTVT